MTTGMLNEPEDDLTYIAWMLESAYLASRPETQMCFATGYKNVSAREGFGAHAEFWRTLAQEVMVHFNLRDDDERTL